MPLLLRSARIEDIPLLCDVFFSAFAGDLIMASCFPDVPSVRDFWIDGLQKDIPDPSCHVMCIYDTELPQNSIVAYAKWEACTKGTMQTGPLCPNGGDQQIAETFFPLLRKRKFEVMAGQNYWYLACLCCSPAHQGRGAGGMLLRYGLELADNEGKQIYLEASPPGVPVYQKYGFSEVDRVVVLGGKFTEILMVRDGKQHQI